MSSHAQSQSSTKFCAPPPLQHRESKAELQFRKESKAGVLPHRKESHVTYHNAADDPRHHMAGYRKDSRMNMDPASFRRESRYRKDSRMEAVLGMSRRVSTMRSYRMGGSKMTDSNPDQGPFIRFENTYQLGPLDDKKFSMAVAEPIVRNILSSMLDGESYDALQSSRLATLIGVTIKDRMKELSFPRYKYVCSVSLSQCTGQGVQVSSRCLWDSDTDRAVSAEYSNKTLQAVAIVFAIYCE